MDRGRERKWCVMDDYIVDVFLDGWLIAKQVCKGADIWREREREREIRSL